MAPPLADLPFEELAFQLAGAKSRTAALSDELHELRQQLREFAPLHETTSGAFNELTEAALAAARRSDARSDPPTRAATISEFSFDAGASRRAPRSASQRAPRAPHAPPSRVTTPHGALRMQQARPSSRGGLGAGAPHPTAAAAAPAADGGADGGAGGPQPPPTLLRAGSAALAPTASITRAGAAEVASHLGGGSGAKEHGERAALVDAINAAGVTHGHTLPTRAALAAHGGAGGGAGGPGSCGGGSGAGSVRGPRSEAGASGVGSRPRTASSHAGGSRARHAAILRATTPSALPAIGWRGGGGAPGAAGAPGGAPLSRSGAGTPFGATMVRVGSPRASEASAASFGALPRPGLAGRRARPKSGSAGPGLPEIDEIDMHSAKALAMARARTQHKGRGGGAGGGGAAGGEEGGAAAGASALAPAGVEADASAQPAVGGTAGGAGAADADAGADGCGAASAGAEPAAAAAEAAADGGAGAAAEDGAAGAAAASSDDAADAAAAADGGGADADSDAGGGGWRAGVAQLLAEQGQHTPGLVAGLPPRERTRRAIGRMLSTLEATEGERDGTIDRDVLERRLAMASVQVDDEYLRATLDGCVRKGKIKATNVLGGINPKLASASYDRYIEVGKFRQIALSEPFLDRARIGSKIASLADVPLGPSALPTPWATIADGDINLVKTRRARGEQLQKLRRVFFSFDANGNGVLDHTEFRAAMAAMGLQLTTEEIRDVIAKLDKDNSGEIDYEEFVSGMAGFMEDARMPSFMTSRMHRDSAWMTPKPLKFGAMLPQALGFTKAPVFGS